MSDSVGGPWPRYDDLSRNSLPWSSWGVFADDPGRGTANFIDAEAVRRSAASVREGRCFNLDHGLKAFDPPMARARSAPEHTMLHPRKGAVDDVVREFYPQASSQVDGLRHRYVPGHGYYDGVPVARVTEDVPDVGVQLLAEKPIVGRGVLLDVEAVRAEQGEPLDHAHGPVLEVADLDAACRQQGVELRDGDILQVHTGWARWFLDAPTDLKLATREARRATGFRQSRELCRWLWDHRVAVFATDTFAVEVLPVLPDSDFHGTAPHDGGMMHEELIARLGVILGELWKLDDLARHTRETGRWDSFCVVKPLNLLGAAGSPANATAVR